MRVEYSVTAPVNQSQAFDWVVAGQEDTRFQEDVAKVERLTPGPLQVGSRYRITRRYWGISFASITEVTANEPPERHVQAGRIFGMNVSGEIYFNPAQGGTRIRAVLGIDTRGPLRLLDPIMARVFRAQLRRNFGKAARLLAEQAASTMDASSSLGG